MVKNNPIRGNQLASPSSKGISENTVPAVREATLAADTTVRPLSGCSVEFSPCLKLKLAEKDSPHAITDVQNLLVLDTGTRIIGDANNGFQVKGPVEPHVKCVETSFREASGHKMLFRNDRGNFEPTTDGFKIKDFLRITFAPSATFKKAA